MELDLAPHATFVTRPGPVVIVIADGVGVAEPAASNAVALAHTPVLDRLASSELYTELRAHGIAVGLPSDADMGNSEVGHNAIGCGRIFDQGAKLVDQALADRTLYQSDVWTTAISRALTKSPKPACSSKASSSEPKEISKTAFSMMW